MKKITFVIWAKNESKVSFFLAKAIGADLIASYRPSSLAFIRYILQAIDTWKKLRQNKPDFIMVQNPPVFAVLVVYVYSKFYKKEFGIDTHTSGMLEKKWHFFFFLHKFLAKSAKVNTFHNFKNLEMVTNWKLPNTRVLQFYTPLKEEILNETIVLEKTLNERINSQKTKVFMVNRFAGDDAYPEVIETAKIMPNYDFYITGNYEKISLNNLPDNVILTRFLDYSRFIKLMNLCDVVLALTKRKDTVLWSVREALTLEKPMVLSDTEVLRHYFSDFGVFSDHSPADLSEKIKKALLEKEAIIQKQNIFKEKDLIRWKEDVDWIKKII